MERNSDLDLALGKRALVTLDNWFFAPNGRQYRAVFGTVHAIHTAEESLGVKTNARSSNWYLKIGNMMIAGCQIHYALRTDICHAGPAADWNASVENGVREYIRPSTIYFADETTQLASPTDICSTTPSIGAMWPSQGGIYAGRMRGMKGQPDYHLLVPIDPRASIEEIKWGGRGINQTDANCEYDGLANTRALCAAKTDYPAAQWAAGLQIDGFDDFYLPARREFRLAYVNVPELFQDGWHWTSTQDAATSNCAWMQDFDGGSQYYLSKDCSYRARAFRRLLAL